MNKTVKKTLAGAVCLVSVIVGKVYTDYADDLVISKEGPKLLATKKVVAVTLTAVRLMF
ncbi:hypothetical protein I6H44_07920 [Aggregatibacter segnis]|uniref:hypothetical protein n=1 Tax=Aggregatibacter segnis TaxID=739 RepID=UPI0018E18B29|nr:hypothetical protein [Aggregatibacter segnis]QQB09164.1 hypothetical protein I6H44_07920 [Aggregatibacter segnis]